ncbi:HNH protein [Halovirus HCTV-5]|uniref:HNH endonuclease n=1 Tax=Halovirus HCTV-5 TaxID=1273748 RepID=UPI0003348197|nr:HNH endonuclease [Halovirus HCTV-5]AGM11698.1 HNH protein [Halovirus HCTV-5]
MPKCEYCGDELASDSTLIRHKKNLHSDWLPWHCPTCGDGFESESGMRRHHTMVHDESLAKETRECRICGEEFECWEYRTQETCGGDCMRDAQSETIKGEGNPNYRDGYERPRYGSTWDEKREMVLERDNYECRVCGRGQMVSDPLHVHHLVKVKKFDDPDNAHTRDNLITLCATHHRLVETGRIECPDPEAIDEVDVDDVLDY